MTNKINYTQAFPIALLAVSTDLYWNQGQTTCAVLLGGLGGLILKFGDAIVQRIESIKKNHSGRFEFRVSEPPSIDINRDKPSLVKALQRIKVDFREPYEDYLKDHALHTPEEILLHFQMFLQKGCCVGIANTLFDQIMKGQTGSLKKSAKLMEIEDIFYHQISMGFDIQTMIEVPRFFNLTVREEVLKQELKDDVEAITEDIERELTIKSKTQFANLCKHSPMWGFHKSKSFPLQSSPTQYLEQLKKAMLRYPESQNFIGVIELPNHVISFQYGPNGYRIHDPFSDSKGLFEYRDSETFSAELRKHVFYDVLNGIEKPGLLTMQLNYRICPIPLMKQRNRPAAPHDKVGRREIPLVEDAITGGEQDASVCLIQ